MDALGINRGLALPTSRTTGGYFAYRSGMELAAGNMKLVLASPIGSRPMKRDWGSGLPGLLFEPRTAGDPVIRMVVADSVRKWCPDVRINQIAVVSKGRRTQIAISFTLARNVAQPGGSL